MCSTLASRAQRRCWAVTSQKACGDWSQLPDPINYNGMKIVKRGSMPLSEEEFHSIQELAEVGRFSATLREGQILSCAAEAQTLYREAHGFRYPKT